MLPRRKRAHFSNTNYSDCLGPIVPDCWDDEDMWSLSRKEKKAVFGASRVQVGGNPAPGLPTVSKWKTQEKEPVFFHQKPWKLADELVYDYFGRAIVDFSPGSGSWALVAVQRRLPYVAVCSTAEHVSGLQQHLVATVGKHLKESGNPLFDEELEASGKSATSKKKGNKRPANQQGNSKDENAKKAKNDSKQALLDQLNHMYAGGKADDEDLGPPEEMDDGDDA